MSDVIAALDPDHEDRITVETGFIDRHAVKTLPGSKWDKHRQVWTVPRTWTSCISLRALFGDQLHVRENLAGWAQDELDTRITPCMQRRTSLEPPFNKSRNKDLRPFQQAGVEYLTTAERAILADPQGTGKTVQAIRAMAELPYAFPALVVCPNSVKSVWAREYAKWDPERKVQVLDGSTLQKNKQLQNKADVYVINWESLKNHTRLAGYGSYALKKCFDCGGHDEKVTPARCETHIKPLNAKGFNTVISDEAHRGIHPKALQTRALWAVSENTGYRFALTGTPVANRPDDLWAILRFIDGHEWGTKSKWCEFFLQQEFNIFGGLEVHGIRNDRREEFFKTVDPVVRRVPKDAVMPQLPPKVYTTHEVTMAPAQAKAYKQMMGTMIAEMTDGSLVTAGSPLTRFSRLMLLASATGSHAEQVYAGTDENGEDVYTEVMDLSLPSCKADALEEILGDLEDSQQVVVFMDSKKLLRIVGERLEKRNAQKNHHLYKKCSHGEISGDISTSDRDEFTKQFQAGDLRIMLCTFKSASEGITLTAADTMVYLQRAWSSVQNSQSEDRCHRFGSEIHDSINIIDVRTKQSVEEHQMDLLEGKYGRIEDVLRDKETMKKLLEA